MIDAPFRAILPRFVQPLLRLYRWVGITPNQLTVAGFLLAAVAACFTAINRPLLALTFWWLSRLLDGTDGIYARMTNQVTDFGGYLDIVLDMASYSVMILGFAYLTPQWTMAWALVLLLYTLCITTALAFGALESRMRLPPAADNRSLRLGAGLAEGGETGIAYSLFLLLPVALPYLLIIWIAILFWTVVARSLLARRCLGR